jgi:hypothetical protein
MYRKLPRPDEIFEPQGCFPCAVCGRDLDDPRWLLHLVLHGEVMIIHPETGVLAPGASDLGRHCVDDECRGRFGLAEWTEAM